MPKPYKSTKKGKLNYFLKHNPGTYKDSDLALMFELKLSTLNSYMRELALNSPQKIRNTPSMGAMFWKVLNQ